MYPLAEDALVIAADYHRVKLLFGRAIQIILEPTFPFHMRVDAI
jgi:hypothetical protein